MGAHLLGSQVLREKSGVRGEVVEQVGILAAAGEDTDAGLQLRGIVAGVLQRFPGGLQKKAVLRVGVLRLAGLHAEEIGIEKLDSLDDGPGADEGNLTAARGGRLEFLLGEMGDRFHARLEVFPKEVERRRAGKFPRHADDGNAILEITGLGAHESAGTERPRASTARCIRTRA